MYVFTKYENLSERAKNECDELILSISKTYNIPYLKWDSKMPLENQFEELNHMLKSRLVFKLNYSIFSDKINTLAEELREEDKQVINFSKENFKSYGPIKKTETFIHEENKSKSENKSKISISFSGQYCIIFFSRYIKSN